MEIHFHINLHRPNWMRNWSRRRKLIMSLALVLVLFPTAFVIASDTFSDVPNDYFAHDAINAIFGARITTGITPTTYKPEDMVTRGQMAAFLSRGLGRVAGSLGSVKVLTTEPTSIALLKIKTGGASDGTGFVKADAALTALYAGTTGCPCTINFYLSAAGGPTSSGYALTLYNGTGNLTTASGAATIAFQLPTGNLTQNVDLIAYISSTNGANNNMILAHADITALWVPFGAAGGDTLDIPVP